MDVINRIGLGYDIHRLVVGRKLRLGGIHVEFDKGLLGHSDGDVVLHAITDAVLGAAGLPDIGQLFADTDPAYKDADSRGLLSHAVKLAAEQGYRIVNIDVVVCIQSPPLSGHKLAMREAIADSAGLEVWRVNLKAKTGEGIGPVGVGEAVTCTAVAGLKKA